MSEKLFDNEKLLFIINPKAGQKKREDFLVDVINEFNDNGYEVNIRFTRERGDGIKFARNLGNGYDRIVCMGGDGTLNEVIEGILEAGIKVPLGYIPTGSTNDFANSLNLSADPAQAAVNIMQKDVKSIDIGKFNGRYFVYTASAGIFTKASYSAPQTIKNVLGHFAYILEGIKDLTQVKQLKLKIELKDEVIEGNYIFAAICNSTSIGGIMTLDQGKVDFSDGLFEMLLVKFPKDLIELGFIVNQLTAQKYDDKVKLIPISKATISDSTNIDWSLDGEKEEGKETIKFKVVHNAINFIY